MPMTKAGGCDAHQKFSSWAAECGVSSHTVNRCTRRSGAASDVLPSTLFLFMADGCPTALVLILVLASPREPLLPAFTFDALLPSPLLPSPPVLLPSPPVLLKKRFSGSGARTRAIDSAWTFNTVKTQERCCMILQSIAAAALIRRRCSEAVFAAGGGAVCALAAGDAAVSQQRQDQRQNRISVVFNQLKHAPVSLLKSCSVASPTHAPPSRHSLLRVTVTCDQLPPPARLPPPLQDGGALPMAAKRNGYGQARQIY
jgi:hypothetical protein